MSFTVRIAVALIFVFHQLAAGEENCVWCKKETEIKFLDCILEKISSNKDLNIGPAIPKTMVKSLSAASAAIDTQDNIKNLIMQGALSGEILGMMATIKSSGTNMDFAVADVVRSIEECYVSATGVSGTKFAASIGRTVLDSLSDADSSSDDDENKPTPEKSFEPNDNPPPPPFIENAPLPSLIEKFPINQPQGNMEFSQNTPFKPFLPPAESEDSSFQRPRQFPQHGKQNINDRAPNQRPYFSSPNSYGYANANSNTPRNGEHYVPFERKSFSPPRSNDFENNNTPQNQDDSETPRRRDFPQSGSFAFSKSNDALAPFQNPNIPAQESYASSSANAPQRGNNFAPIQRQDFNPPGSYAAATFNNAPFQRQNIPPSDLPVSPNDKAPQQWNNFVPNQPLFIPAPSRNLNSNGPYPEHGIPSNDQRIPMQRQGFLQPDSYTPDSASAARNTDNFAPSHTNRPPSDSYAPPSFNVRQNRDNFVPDQKQDFRPSNSYGPTSSNPRQNGDHFGNFHKQDFPASNSFAAANSNAAQNEDNYAPNNNDQSFTGRKNEPKPYLPLISPNLTVPESNPPPFVPANNIGGLEPNGLYPSDKINSNEQPINPLRMNPDERNANKNLQESNAVARSQSSVGGSNYEFQDYPDFVKPNGYKKGNVGPNEYYNDNGNNKPGAEGISSYDLIPEDYNYNPINSQVSTVNFDDNYPQSETFPSNFPLQRNLPQSYQPQSDGFKKQNSKSQPETIAVTNTDEEGKEMMLPKQNSDEYSLTVTQKLDNNNNQPKEPGKTQSDDNGSEKWQPNEENLALAQDNFNEKTGTNSNGQINILPNDYWSQENGLNSEKVSMESTTPATQQEPTASKPEVYSNKTCALEFSEGFFVPLSQSDSFSCVFNEETPHNQAISIAANALQKAFSDARLGKYAHKAKRNCFREVSQLPSGSTSQKYAEKISKAAMVVVYKNNLLNRNCKEEGTFMAEKILKAISDISDSSNTDNNEQNEELPANETENPFQSNYVPDTGKKNREIKPTQHLDSTSYDNNYDAPQSERTSNAESIAGYDAPEEYPDNYDSPQGDNDTDTLSGGPSDESQVPEGNQKNLYPRRKFKLKRRNRNNGRVEYPNDFDKNVPDDGTKGDSTDTLAESPGLNSRNPNYYQGPQIYNAPNTAYSPIESQGITGGSPYNYDNNGPNKPRFNSQRSPSPKSVPESASAASEGAEVPEDTVAEESSDTSETSGAPGNNYPRKRFLKKQRTNNRRVGFPDTFNENVPDDAVGGDILASPPSLSRRNPNYYNAPLAYNAPDSAFQGSNIQPEYNYENNEANMPADNDQSSPQLNDESQSAAFSEGTEREVPDDASGGPENASVIPGPRDNNYLRRKFIQKQRNKNRRRDGYPNNFGKKAPDDATSGDSINDNTFAASPGLDGRNPKYYNSPQSHNKPNSVPPIQGPNYEYPYNYDDNGQNQPDYNEQPSFQPNSPPDSASAVATSEESGGPAPDTSGGTLDESQTPGGAPGNKYPRRRLRKKQKNNNRENNKYPAPFDKNAPDDVASVPQFSDSGHPDYDNAPESDNVPVFASSAAESQGPNNESPYIYDNSNGSDLPISNEQLPLQSNSPPSPGNKYPQRRLRKKLRNNNREKNGYPDTFDENVHENTASIPQFPDSRNTDNYNAPEADDAPVIASSAAESQGPNNESPYNYDYNNGPDLPISNQQPSFQSKSPPDSASAASEVSEGAAQDTSEAPGNNYPRRRIFKHRNSNRGKAKHPDTWDEESAPDAAAIGPQFSDGENADYNNAPVFASSAAESQGPSNESPYNYDNNESDTPDSSEQPFVENNTDFNFKYFKYLDTSNSKENPLLHELVDSDSKNHIDYLMKTAMSCVSENKFKYKDFAMGMASVATAMKNEHPDKSPEEIIRKTYVATIVALIQDLQNAVFTKQENNRLQSTQDSQPPPNEYRSNDDFPEYEPNQQNSESSAAANSEYGLNGDYPEYGPNQQNGAPSAVAIANSEYGSNGDYPEYGSNGDYPEYGPNQQNSESSAVASANSESDPVGYRNNGNYQNTFLPPASYKSPLQMNMNPSFQNVGQNNFDISNMRNNLLNSGSYDQPTNFDNNKGQGFAYAVAG